MMIWGKVQKRVKVKMSEKNFLELISLTQLCLERLLVARFQFSYFGSGTYLSMLHSKYSCEFKMEKSGQKKTFFN